MIGKEVFGDVGFRPYGKSWFAWRENSKDGSSYKQERKYSKWWFDPLHVGHVELFYKAKDLSSKLIVV